MIRKLLAVAGIAALSLLGTAGAAQAYTPPEEPIVEVPVDPATIDPGEQVPVLMSDWLPNSQSQFSVSADGVDGADIGLVVLGSRSVSATVGTDGSYTVGVTFPEGGVYTLAASGLDTDGNAKVVSTVLSIAGGGSGGGGEGTGGGLPFTGSNSFAGLLLGAGLAGAGGAVVLLSRRRTQAHDSIDA